MPGIITSSSIKSGGLWAMAARACSPSATLLVRYPSGRSNASRSLRLWISSSTMRMVALGVTSGLEYPGFARRAPAPGRQERVDGGVQFLVTKRFGDVGVAAGDLAALLVGL